jgi:hypothetical protein
MGEFCSSPSAQVVKLQPGDYLKRGDEVGKLMYGGSSILVAFGKGRVWWDGDIG